jgi:putative pyruvate formate lyase activating enzyme
LGQPQIRMDRNMNASTSFQPAYLNLLKNQVLQQRAAEANRRMERCELCALKCRVNRRAGQIGGCRIGERAVVSSYGPHMGEEPPLRGSHGSGTVFFAGCNLRCQYCQNHEISQTRAGEEMEPEELAAVFLRLQAQGCHNINLVSPSHMVAQILAAVCIAAQRGLRLPLVYNTGGYDSLETLQLLDGVIDIYMPDMKYSSPQIARKYSRIINYPKVNQAAVREMHRQVGDLQTDARGIAMRGLLVRHLVLPNHLAGTKEVVRFLAEEVSPETYLNIMDQYYPAFEAQRYPSLNRPIRLAEMEEALAAARGAGLKRFLQA